MVIGRKPGRLAVTGDVDRFFLGECHLCPRVVRAVRDCLLDSSGIKGSEEGK